MGDANLKGSEILAQAMIEKLQRYMPQRAQAINNFFGNQDQTQIQAPANTNYFAGRVKELATPPAVYVMEGPTQWFEEGSHGLISHTEMLVYILESDQTGPLLATRLRRQVKAVIESLWDDDPAEKLTVQNGPYAGQDSAFLLVPLRSVPGSVFEPTATDDWRGIYTVIFEAHQLEH